MGSQAPRSTTTTGGGFLFLPSPQLSLFLYPSLASSLTQATMAELTMAKLFRLHYSPLPLLATVSLSAEPKQNPL
jgi:hypothetical protein